jgi:putative transposase
MVNQDLNGDGPLFRNRFKSILIKDNRYLLQVSRYIHLNPVEAQLCVAADDYPWSSCRDFFFPDPFQIDRIVQTHFLLGFFKNPAEYREFVEIGNAKPFQAFYDRKNVPSILTI